MKVALSLLTMLLIGSILSVQCRAQDIPSGTPAAGGAAPDRNERKTQLLQQYRFYAGAHVAAQVFRVVSTTYPIQEAVVRPPYVFAGYRLGPHWALQGGFLQNQRPILDESGVRFDNKGQTYTFKNYYNEYNAAIPVLLRYDIARRPPHRLHLDLLLGITLVAHRYQADYVTSATATYPAYEQHEYAHSNNLFATGGLGLGYRVTSHIDLMVEATANRNLSAPDYAAGARKINFGVGAGLRYHFDLLRSASQSLVR